MIIPKDFERYFQLLGWFVHSWSQVERQLDIYVAVAWHRCGADSLGEPYPRTQFNRKLSFLRLAVPLLPAETDYPERVILVVDRCADLVGFRDTIIHGTADTLDAEMVTINRLAIDKIGNITNAHVIISWDTFNAHCLAADEVATFALKLSEVLLKISPRTKSAKRSPKAP